MYLGSQVDVYTRMQNLINCIRVWVVWLPRCIRYFIWNREEKARIFCREAEVDLRLIVLQYACRVCIFIVTNLTLPKGEKGGYGAKAPYEGRYEVSGASIPSPRVQGRTPLGRAGGGRRLRLTTSKSKWKKNNNYSFFQFCPFSFSPLSYLFL